MNKKTKAVLLVLLLILLCIAAYFLIRHFRQAEQTLTPVADKKVSEEANQNKQQESSQELMENVAIKKIANIEDLKALLKDLRYEFKEKDLPQSLDLNGKNQIKVDRGTIDIVLKDAFFKQISDISAVSESEKDAFFQGPKGLDANKVEQFLKEKSFLPKSFKINSVAVNPVSDTDTIWAVDFIPTSKYGIINTFDGLSAKFNARNGRLFSISVYNDYLNDPKPKLSEDEARNLLKKYMAEPKLQSQLKDMPPVDQFKLCISKNIQGEYGLVYRATPKNDSYRIEVDAINGKLFKKAFADSKQEAKTK